MADAARGPWPLVVANTALFTLVAASLFRPKSTRDGRTTGVLIACPASWTAP